MSTQPVVMDPAIEALLARTRGAGVTPIATPSREAIPLQTPPPLPAFMQVQQSQAMQRLPTPDAPTQGMPSPMQPLPMPAQPSVSKIPTPQDQAITTTNQRTLGDINRMQYLDNSGSGIDQITKPVDPTTGMPTGQHVSGLRRFGGVLARIGGTALSIASPGVAALTPGTDLHHRMLLNQQQGMVDDDLQNQQSEAGTQQEQALTNYTQQRPDIEEAKIAQHEQAVRDRVEQAAAARGQVTSWDPNTRLPTFSDDVTSQAYADHQALSAMHQATADKSAIQSDIAKNHYIPGTPEFTEAQRKLSQVDKRLQVAISSLGLRAQGLELRKENQAAMNTGVDPETGQPFAGAAQIEDGSGGPTTIGARFAGHAITQQNKVGAFNDLQGSVAHLRNALQAFEAEGGDMSDARLTQAASDPTSVIGKVINGKLVTGGLSPAALTLLNAQRQTMEQAGILRSTTGGTSSEAGAQRILQVVPQFGSDTNKSAYSKLDEQEGVLKRLAPGVTSVAGGMKVHSGGSAGSNRGMVRALDPQGVLHEAPAGTPLPAGWKAQ